MNKNIVIIVSLVVVALALFTVFNGKDREEQATTNQDEPAQSTSQNNRFAFTTPKKSAHYESNTPEHGSVLPAPPINVVINFNFDLAAPSEISITKDGQEYGNGQTTIDNNKLSMRHAFDLEAPDGLYQVMYNACWPDRSCHDGHFEFAIDRSQAATYQDMTRQANVTINMSEIMFKPANIKISAGTKVTWINDESVEHYINTDSHPAHTYFPEQNSSALKEGESYSTTFTQAGVYPYHCSAHAHTMTGNILVI